MRPVGKAQTLISAKRFSQKLSSDKIDHRIEPSFHENALWQIWLVDENQMEKGREIWGTFQRGDCFQDTATDESVPLFSAVAKAEDQERKLSFDKTWVRSSRANYKTPLVFFVGLACSLCSTASWFNTTPPLSFIAQSLDLDKIQSLASYAPIRQPVNSDKIEQAQPQIALMPRNARKGIWRIWLPSFFHINAAHLGIQLCGFWIFARQIERAAGTWKLMLLLVVAAGFINCAQFFALGIYPVGLAGVACACAEFCHDRCRQFPWEGYRTGLWGFHLVRCNIVVGVAFQAFASASSALGSNYTVPTAALSAFAPICGLVVGRCLARVPFMGPRNSASS